MLATSWGAKAARWAGTAGLIAAFLAGGIRPAAADYHEMEPGDARFVDHFVAAGPLQDPADGRLRGYGFSATVGQIGEASSVEFRSYVNTAPRGYKIVVFGVRYSIQGERRDYDRPVKGTVVIDGSRSPLDFDFGQAGDRTVAAAVPAGAKEVLFEMASAGVAQTFSLTERRRVGAEPAVLYRDAAWPDVVSDLTADRVVKAKDDDASASVTLAVKRVRLSWFSPGPTASGSAEDPIMTPSTPDRAFLIVEGEGFSDARGDGPYFKGFEGIPASDVRLKLPDGSTVEARHAGDTEGLLGGAYYFEVPATLGSATLVVGPTSVTALRRVGAADVPTTARLDAATFKLSVPGGDSAQESEGNPTTPGGAGSDEAGAPNESESRSGGNVVPATVLLLVLGAAGGGLLLRRRSRVDEGGPAPRPAVAADVSAEGPVEETTLDALADGPFVPVSGPGALNAARAAVLADAGEGPAARVVLATAETAALCLPDAAAPPWLTIVTGADDLPAAVEVARLRSFRADGDAGDEDEPATGRRVVVAVPASFDGAAGRALKDAVERGAARLDTLVLVVGHPDGLFVERDGTVAHGGGRARVPLLDADAAAALFEPTATVEAEPPPSAPVAAPRRVDVRVFGPCRITVDGREVATAGRTKSRELLMFLAVNRRGATPDAAMEALWPGAEPDGPYFRKVLADLRAIVREATGLEGDPVQRVGGQLRLDPSVFDVDLWRFEDALAAAGRGDDDAAQAAAEEYAGDLLKGEDLLWADVRREPLWRRALNNLADLSDRQSAAGDLAGALRAAEMAVELDPDTEEHYQRVMALCRALGRPDGARRAFDALEARLRALGHTPSAKSRELGTGPAA